MWVSTGKLWINLDRIVMVETRKREDGFHLLLWDTFETQGGVGSYFELDLGTTLHLQRFLVSDEETGFGAVMFVAPIDKL